MCDTSFLLADRKKQKEETLYQLIGKDNWESIDAIDNFLYVFDRMPKDMKLIIDMKVDGYSNKEIAELLHKSQSHVCVQVNRAKKRIFKAYLR
jgi:RNA polymerase sigma factor (sigma-70 family)